MSPTHHSVQAGTVYLVGSGPGALDLMTVRATRLIGEADAVVHDHLIADGVLGLVRSDAQIICVGKKASNHTVPQGELNLLLVRLAREGKKVVRLKGGDPFIFGRGGEEIETLFEFGIPFEVVPGVTAAAGCAAYAGIPLTHRDHAQTVTFATGHLKDGSVELDWHALARRNQTTVFLHGNRRHPRNLLPVDRAWIATDAPGHRGTKRQHGTTACARRGPGDTSGKNCSSKGHLTSTDHRRHRGQPAQEAGVVYASFGLRIACAIVSALRARLEPRQTPCSRGAETMPRGMLIAPLTWNDLSPLTIPSDGHHDAPP